MNQYNSIEEEIIKRKSVARREGAARLRKKQQFIDRLFKYVLPAAIAVSIITGAVFLILMSHEEKEEKAAVMPNISIEKIATEFPEEEEKKPEHNLTVYSAEDNAATTGLPSDVVSSYGILIDLADDTILAQRNARERISPASMTKILTALVACEHLTEEDLDQKMTITLEFTDYSYRNDLSAVGFAENEEVTIRDLLYGTILPSGGDAAIALATYIAGSEEAFVEMMNDRLGELQLSDSTHFTNVAGMYDEQHYSTVYDMAMIMHAGIDNKMCREVLNAHTYTTSSTEQHPDGITVSNWFLRRIEDKDCGLTVECAKTGFVVQSRNCAASFADDEDGHGYICVTADSTSGWRCIYDHVSIYSAFSGLTERPAIPADDALPDDDTLTGDEDAPSDLSEEDILSSPAEAAPAIQDEGPAAEKPKNSSGITVNNTVINNSGD